MSRQRIDGPEPDEKEANPQLEESVKAWSRREVVSYYARTRNSYADLYPSERVFLPKVLHPGSRVLDVGCAAGGFFNIMRSLQPDIQYTGIDVAEPSIEIARERYPEARFEVTDGLHFPFGDCDFDLVHCTGVLVNQPAYRELLAEMHRVARRFVIVDIRLLKGVKAEVPPEQSVFRIKYDSDTVLSKVPYSVCDADEVLDFILALQPRPLGVSGTGYFHPVSEMAETPFREVCMAVLLIEKGKGGVHKTHLDLREVPLEFSAATEK